MALRAVADHPKLSRLKSLLGCGRGEAMGYLEAAWHFTGRFTPQGNIGKYSDAEIEAWIEWKGKPGELVSMLVESGWLESSQSHRILVHDWHDHADDATRLSLKRKKQSFLTIHADSVPTVSGLPVPVPVPEPEPEPVQNTPPIACATPPRLVELARSVGESLEAFAPIDADPLEAIPDGLTTVEYARSLLSELSISAPVGLQDRFAETITLLAQFEFCNEVEATKRLAKRMREAMSEGPVKWRFWLEDDGWKGIKPQARASPATVGMHIASAPSEAEQRDAWEAMPERWKQSHPWSIGVSHAEA